VLPDLSHNIQCGNSLIGPDIYEGQQLGFLDAEEAYHINAFDWEQNFREIMREGGFDAVIGNPPYVRQESLGANKSYFQQRYKVYHGMADLYAYFIERGVTLLKPGGLFSYIVANKWMRANYGAPLRRWLKEQQIEEIIDFGELPVFKSVTTYPCILRVSKPGQDRKPCDLISVSQVKTLEFTDLADYVHSNSYSVNRQGLSESGWSLGGGETEALLAKLRAAGAPLGEYVQGKIYRGILTGLNEAFVIDGATRDRLITSDPSSSELIVPFLAGRDVKRYATLPTGRWLILIPRGWTRQHSQGAKNAWLWLQNQYPGVASHLAPYAVASQKRYDKGEYWWELRACDYYDEFTKDKIIIPAIVANASYNYDENGFYSNDKTSIIPTDDKYLLGLLNSSTIDYFMHQIASTKQGGYYEYKPMYVSQLPIHLIDYSSSSEVAFHDQMVDLVERMLDLHKRLAAAQLPQEKTMLQRQIEATDKQIDRLVYELYGLTEEEIAIVEGAG